MILASKNSHRPRAERSEVGAIDLNRGADPLNRQSKLGTVLNSAETNSVRSHPYRKRTNEQKASTICPRTHAGYTAIIHWTRVYV
jgi:hypothetical protein